MCGVILCFVLLAGRLAAAQTAHVHYTAPPHLASQAASPSGALAPRLQNLGAHVFKVSTRNQQAQRFINQGLNLAYAFNHAEARRSFAEAARLDATLAMAFWGQALVLGPNINMEMEPNEEPRAYELVQQASKLKGSASPRERALIEALVERYSGKADDREPRNLAYATAMRKVYERFPDDPDIAMLYVEAMMDLRPWGYWREDGAPHEGTAEIIALTERVLAKNPRHPGATHMYIHLMEASNTPEKAVPAADTLLTLMPAAGHMVHMPAHIYHRIGRYADSIKANQMAVAADEDYIAQCKAEGLYPIGYYPHNIHFLWFSASADGQSAVALDAARKVVARIDDEALETFPPLVGLRVALYFALTRFGRWEEMLNEPEPPEFATTVRGAWHYARGLAFLGTGKPEFADEELEKLDALTADAGSDLFVGVHVLAGEIAAAREDYERAIAHLDRAVRLDDGLGYAEPVAFDFAPRQRLGAVLLEAGRPAEAETVYWEDLRRNRENGWSLFGLLQAQQAQEKKDEAMLTETRFKRAWARADVTLAASRIGPPR